MSIRLAVFFLAFFLAGQASAAKLVVSIPPLAMLAQPLLDEQDEVVVLLTPGATPHGFQLKPSHRLALDKADLVISVGTGVDVWLNKALQSYSGKQVVMRQTASELLEKRSGKNWGEGHKHAHAHEQITMDGHIWLSLPNAKATLKDLAEKLSELKPHKKEVISMNLQLALQELETKQDLWLTELQPYKSKGFVVAHDAFQYFEKAFGLQASGSIYINPELPLSAKRVAELRKQVKNNELACIFAEPQFPQQRIQAVISQVGVVLGKLDPLGADNKIVPYVDFYQKLVTDFKSCFDEEN